MRHHRPAARTVYGRLVAPRLDPFCGSGTVLLESALCGRVGHGADSNPLARMIARVKTTVIDTTQAMTVARQIELKSGSLRGSDAAPAGANDIRSEKRGGGKECVRTWRSRREQRNKKKKKVRR